MSVSSSSTLWTSQIRGQLKVTVAKSIFSFLNTTFKMVRCRVLRDIRVQRWPFQGQQTSQPISKTLSFHCKRTLLALRLIPTSTWDGLMKTCHWKNRLHLCNLLLLMPHNLFNRNIIVYVARDKPRAMSLHSKLLCASSISSTPVLDILSKEEFQFPPALLNR